MICLDLLEAGMETVGNTLDFFILYLVLNESIQRRVHNEIDHFIGNTRAPVLDDRNQSVIFIFIHLKIFKV